MEIVNPILPQEEDPFTMLPSQVQSDEDTSDTVTEIESFWTNEIARARKVREMFEPSWRSARKAWRNRWYPDFEGGKPNIMNGVFYSDVEVTVANLAANPPQFTVDIAGEQNIGTAVFVKNALKYELKRLRFPNLYRQFVRDAAIYNIAIAKTSYNFEKTVGLDADAPYIQRISPFNWLIDPECTDVYNARWAGEEKFFTVEEFRSRYRMNTDRAIATASEYVVNTEMRAENNTTMRTGVTDKAVVTSQTEIDYNTVSPSQIKRIKITEIYDAAEGKIITLADGRILVEVKSYGLGEGDIKYVRHLPYRVLRFNTMNDFFYCDSDFDIHKSKLFEIDEVSNRIYEALYRMIPKGMYNKNAVKNDEMTKICRAKMSQMVGIDVPAGTNINELFSWVPMASIDPNNWNALNELKQSHNTDTGIADFQKGGSPSGKQTATETMVMAQGVSGRSGMRQTLCDEFLDEVITSLFYVLKHTMDNNKWIPFAGTYPVTRINAQTGQTEILKLDGKAVEEKMKGFMFTPDMLQSEFLISIEAGATGMQKGAQEQAMLLNMYKVLGDNPALNKTSMARVIINSYNRDPDEVLYSPEQMAQQQQQQAAPPNQAPSPQPNIPVNPPPEGQVVGNPLTQVLNRLPVR